MTSKEILARLRAEIAKSQELAAAAQLLADEYEILMARALRMEETIHRLTKEK